ncbi:MAG: aminoglycoside phosphotransferase family protein [Pseudobdellovibrionaceae bacterium]
MGPQIEHKEDFHKSFLGSHFGEDTYNLYQLAGDASSRKYYRVVKDNQSWVLMRWEPFDPKAYPFLSVLNHFAKHKIEVPEVVALSPKEGLVLLEDLGDLTLERKFWENQSQDLSLDFYKKTVDELVKIHYPASLDKTDCTAFKVEFDAEKLLWELNYAREHLLEGVCQFKIEGTLKANLQNTLAQIAERLHQEPKTIAHRDYHSRNVMIKFDKVRVIDFQDARMGPIQYDLVSLLRDSYVTLNDAVSNKLLDYYLDQAKAYLPKNFSRSHFDRIYELQTIQRCFKACGSFSSFYMLRKDTRYLKYISHTLKLVLKSLAEFPEYRILHDAIIDSGALERKYESL